MTGTPWDGRDQGGAIAEPLEPPGWHAALLLGNPVWKWGLALLAATAVLLALSALRALLRRRAERLAEAELERAAPKGESGRARRISAVRPSEVLAAFGASASWFLLAVSIWAGSLVLELAPDRRALAGSVATAALLLQGGLWISRLGVGALRRIGEERRARDPASVTGFTALEVLLRAGIWILVGLLVLANLRVDVTGLVAGLGIGGIAIALAVQNVLGDLFASLSIVLDKPFEVGDFVVIGDLSGTIERVGLKTTRIRSLSGEQVVVSNADLLSSRIANYKRMRERRVLFSFGVVYQTRAEQLAAIPAMVREIVEARPKTRFERAHFHGFGESSLDFEVVYFLLGPEYNEKMDVQQEINLELVRRFEAESIEFAYPTRTVYLANSGQESAPELPGA